MNLWLVVICSNCTVLVVETRKLHDCRSGRCYTFSFPDWIPTSRLKTGKSRSVVMLNSRTLPDYPRAFHLTIVELRRVLISRVVWGGLNRLTTWNFCDYLFKEISISDRCHSVLFRTAHAKVMAFSLMTIPLRTTFSVLLIFLQGLHFINCSTTRGTN